jgi:hypothetical protein
MLLTYKLNSTIAVSMDQALCVRVVGNGSLNENLHVLQDPTDTIAGYIRNRVIGGDVSVQATRVFSQSSSPFFIRHFSNFETTVVSHPDYPTFIR